MKILIVGARGLVGKEFARQFSDGHQVLALTHRDLDITDTPGVRSVVLNERPALVINCAVLGVDACELDPSLAWAVNVLGAENLANPRYEIKNVCCACPGVRNCANLLCRIQGTRRGTEEIVFTRTEDP